MPEQTIHTLLENRDFESLKQYIAENKRCLKWFIHGEQALIHYAAYRGNIDLLRVLLAYGADIYYPSKQSGYLALHYAAISGQLKVVQYLLEEAPDSLELADGLGQTAALWALVNGRKKVVDYLKTLRACFLDLPVEEEVTGKPVLPVTWLLERFHFKTLSTLFLSQVHASREAALLTHLDSVDQVLGLIEAEPKLLPFFLQYPEFQRQIGACIQIPTKNTLHLYVPAKQSMRRRSFYIEADKAGNPLSLFFESSTLSKGRFGQVRLFKSETGEMCAVKSPRKVEKLHESVKKEENMSLLRGLRLYARAYPEDRRFGLFDFNVREGRCYWHNNRVIQDYIAGQTFGALWENGDLTAHVFPKLVLVIAEELDRIHALGIVHMDVHPWNIMVQQVKDDFTVRLIDFDLACEKGRDEIKQYNKKSACNSLPPEAYEAPVLADSSYDVYRFGYSLKGMLKPKTEEFETKFSAIRRYINASQAAIPSSRPSLSSFCSDLKNDIAAEESKVHVISPGLVP